MKTFSFALVFLLLIALTLNHAVTTLNSRGNNAYASYLEDCASAVTIEKSYLFAVPTQIEVSGWDCVGPDSSGSKYTAQIWDHFFWLFMS